ncbi:uncharacterized protein ACO6RY_13101 [Pungitius sinensis]
MRGLILLCLWGLFLEASTATWLHGSQLPMSGPSSFEIKANTSTEHEEHGPNNTSSQVTATPLTVESTAVVMLSKDREDRQLSKDSTTPVPKSKPKPVGTWHFLGNKRGFSDVDEEANTVKPQ